MEDLKPTTQRRLEAATVLTLWPGVGLSMVGAGLNLVPADVPLLQRPGLALMILGLMLATASVAFSYPVSTLRSLAPDRTGGEEYDRLRHWRNLKAAALLLNALALGGAIVFLLDLSVRADIVRARFDVTALDRGSVVLVLAMAASHALAHHYALRFPVDRDLSGTRLILTLLGAAIGLLAAALAGLAILREQGLQAGLGLGAETVPLLVLGGHVFAAYALFTSRRLPTFSVLYSEEKDTYAVPAQRSGRNVFLPAIIAFALLLLVFLLFVLFGVGVAEVISSVARSPVVLGAVSFLVLALVISVGAAVTLARSEDEGVTLWRAPRNPRERLQATILISSVALGALLLFVSFLVWRGVPLLGLQAQAWVHFFCIGLLVMVGPYGFYMASEHKRIRMLEERLPDFLRDIASSHKGGLTLTESVRVASRGEYGPLTPEIHKMADQLSWNVPFSEALVRFGDRVQTPLVERAVSLIQEADRSGGATTDVLIAAARDAREIKNMENERRLSMSLYTVVIYITFFVFLAVAAVLYAQFVPEMVRTSEAAAELGGGDLKGIGSSTLRLEDFQLFYFMAAVMQGLGDGIVAGIMGAGRAVLGLRHAFIMVLISYLTFTLFLV